MIIGSKSGLFLGNIYGIQTMVFIRAEVRIKPHAK
jgi:hypothetical protein